MGCNRCTASYAAERLLLATADASTTVQPADLTPLAIYARPVHLLLPTSLLQLTAAGTVLQTLLVSLLPRHRGSPAEHCQPPKCLLCCKAAVQPAVASYAS